MSNVHFSRPPLLTVECGRGAFVVHSNETTSFKSRCLLKGLIRLQTAHGARRSRRAHFTAQSLLLRAKEEKTERRKKGVDRDPFY